MSTRMLLSLALVAWSQAAISAASLSSALAPPAGSALIGRYMAKGSQIYTCGGKGEALAWSAAVPDAELHSADGHSIGRHFKGPTWEARDGSKVIGSVIAKAPAPKADAVPWLLLSAKTMGSGLLAGTKYVVRQDTAGGVEPSGPCGTPGTMVSVPYTATYAFYQ